MKKNLSSHIIPTLPFDFVNKSAFENATIYDGFIENEIEVAPSPKCFLGAYYRKVFSSFDAWIGIEGKIKLGRFHPDPNRFGNDGRVIYNRQLDNIAIYMGGKAISESDAGLTWASGQEDLENFKAINYGSIKNCYRPFWRHIYEDVKDENGNVLRSSINSWQMPDPNDVNTYFFPGDVINMAVYSPLENYLQLKIELLEPTQISEFKKIREKLKISDKQIFYSPLFYSKGHGISHAEFKRVNSIDQYGNEGFMISQTNAFVSKATWYHTYLYRKIDNKLYKVFLNQKRQTQMACPLNDVFKIEDKNDIGGESLTIEPKNSNLSDLKK